MTQNLMAQCRSIGIARITTCVVLTAGMLIGAASPAAAQRGRDDGPQEILQVTFAMNSLTIRVDRIGSKAPRVWLAEQPLTVEALNQAAGTIQVALPSNLENATYPLRIGSSNRPELARV